MEFEYDAHKSEANKHWIDFVDIWYSKSIFNIQLLKPKLFGKILIGSRSRQERLMNLDICSSAR